HTPTTLSLLSFFLSPSSAHPALHSFPTRRSSDLRCWPAVGCSSSHTSAPRPDGRSRVSRSCAPNRSAIALKSSSWLTFCLVTTRSEEHTSELQSRGHLVCRLLLEKKKKE